MDVKKMAERIINEATRKTTSPVPEAPKQDVILPGRSTSPVMDTTMDFLKAIEQVMSGKMITSATWNDKSEYALIKDDYLMIHHKTGKFDCWLVRKSDMDLTDWIVIVNN